MSLLSRVKDETENLLDSLTGTPLAQISLAQSIERCQKVVAAYDYSFYWGSLLLPWPKRAAMWAVYAWFRQKDEQIDRAGSRIAKQQLLQRWFQQLEAMFSCGQPAITTDIALLDAIERYQLTIEPFKDMLRGQQMSLDLDRYQTWEEVRLYCYLVGGTVGLVSASILSDSPEPDSCEALVTFGIAMQITNILQDVGADARQGKIYLSLEDLKRFRYSVKDIFRAVTNREWTALISYEIQRARALYKQVEVGLEKLPKDVLYPMWAAWALYQQPLKAIERDGYNTFGKRPVIPLLWKVNALIWAWWRSHRRSSAPSSAAP